MGQGHEQNGVYSLHASLLSFTLAPLSSRKSYLIASLINIVLALSCYFSWHHLHLKFTFGSSGCQKAKNSSAELGIFTGGSSGNRASQCTHGRVRFNCCCGESFCAMGMETLFGIKCDLQTEKHPQFIGV